MILGFLDSLFLQLEKASAPNNRRQGLSGVQAADPNHIFNSKLTEFEKNGYRLQNRSDSFSCGYPGETLTKCGLNPRYEILIMQSTLRKAFGQVKSKADEAHDLVVEELYNLPQKIQNPILVISGNTHNSRLIFIDIERKGRKMLAALQVQRQSERGKYSAIVSIYSKPVNSVAMLIEEALAKNAIWHVDREKIKGFLSVTGQLQLLPRIIESLNGTNIAQKKSESNTLPSKKYSKNLSAIHALLGTCEALQGLDGAWKNETSKFKENLINDIKTFLFGKWEKPWKETLPLNEKGQLLLPRSIRGKVYSEINAIVLENAYENSPFFVTPRYVSKHGGKIIKPEKLKLIVGLIPFVKDEKGNLEICPKDQNPELFLPRPYKVISTDYVEGIKVPPFKYVELEKKELIQYAEDFISLLVKLKRLPRLIYDQKDSCFYSPTVDEIHLVKINQFTKIEGYYSTLFHEIVHSTKHSSRLGRGKPLNNSNRKAQYAAEELVAEMGAMMLSAELGLNYHRQNSITYLKGWLDEAVRQSGKDTDAVLLEAYGYAVDAVEYLIDGVDVDALIPQSVKDKATGSDEKGEKPIEPKPSDATTTQGKPNTAIAENDTPKTNPPLNSKQVRVIDVPVKSIFTDEKRFQNRVNAYSEESKNRIIRAVNNGTFDWAKFDPITIWLDPKDKRYYVLSGHSRRAAFIELSKSKPEFANIPAKIFAGSEKEAVDFALNSNTLATRETEVERALYYAKQRLICELNKGLNGKSDCEKMVEEQCRENEGKNANYILNLSYLNPNGYLMESLSRMGIEKDNDSTILLRTIANWIGEARRKFPYMTDAQETECAQFLINGGYGNKKNQFRNKSAFLERLEFALARWKTNGSKADVPLNLANNVTKSIFEKEWDERLAKAKEELDNAIKEHEEKYKKYLMAVIEGQITQERMDELMKPIIKQVERAKNEYERIRGQKDDVKKAATAQTSLWGVDEEKSNSATSNFGFTPQNSKNRDEFKTLGFVNLSEKHSVRTYKLNGELGKFLGEYDRNRYSIVIRGDKGAGKSRLLYQLINAFAGKRYRIAFLSLEMGIHSAITERYKSEFISPANLKRIDITDTVPDYVQLNAICKNYDVLAIDSWTKLRGLEQSDFDRLQKDNPGTIIISIFQSTTSKVTRGGNMPEYDAAVVIHVHKGGIAECEKNRFAPTTQSYNVFSKNLTNSEVVENA